MEKALSPEEALAEVSSYTGLLLSADDIRSLHPILTKPRKDSAIRSHLKAENHPLGHLPHQPEGENWWDKVHADMVAAGRYTDAPPGTNKNPTANDRKAVISWLEHRILPALIGKDTASATSNGKTGTGAQDQAHPPVPPPNLPGRGPGGGPGLDPNPARRTAKKDYGEDQARMWAEKEFPGALVQKVGNWVPKLGYDVRVTLADESEVHIEAKYSEDGSEVILTEGERWHNLNSGCIHEHVLYMVAGAQATEADGEWHCSGGTEDPHRDWIIDAEDLEPMSWRYKVPAS